MVSQIFPHNIDIVERSDFIEFMSAQREISVFITSFHTQFTASVAAFRQKILDRIQIQQFIRRMLLEVQKSVYAKIKDIEDEKAKKAEEKKNYIEPEPVKTNDA